MNAFIFTFILGSQCNVPTLDKINVRAMMLGVDWGWEYARGERVCLKHPDKYEFWDCLDVPKAERDEADQCV